MYRFLCEYKVLLLQILKSGIARSFGKSTFNFIRNYQTFAEWLYHSAFPPAPSKGSCCSLASPAFAVSVLNFPNSNRCTAGSLWCFNLQLPQGIQDVENLFTRLCVICMTSLVRYPFRYFAHFLHQAVFSAVLCIFWVTVFYFTCFEPVLHTWNKSHLVVAYETFFYIFKFNLTFC